MPEEKPIRVSLQPQRLHAPHTGEPPPLRSKPREPTRLAVMAARGISARSALPVRRGLAASRLGLAASEGGLQLAQHLPQPGQRFAVACPLAPALRLDRPL